MLPARWRLRLYGAALVVLCSCYYLVVVALGYVAHRTVFAEATVGQYLLAAVVLGLAGYLTVTELRQPRRILEELDARKLEGEHPGLESTVIRLAKQADVPKPELWVAPLGEPNSLTVGYRTPAICLTEGMLERFRDEPDRLEAVLAHELSHAANRDAQLLTAMRAPDQFLVFVIVVSGSIGALFYAVGGKFLAPDWFLDRYLLLIGLGYLGLFLVWIALFLAFGTVADAFSRTREFAADRAAAALTGDPVLLAVTLRELEGADAVPDDDLRESAVGRFCILPIGDDERYTHPPIDERVERLRVYQRTLERTS